MVEKWEAMVVMVVVVSSGVERSGGEAKRQREKEREKERKKEMGERERETGRMAEEEKERKNHRRGRFLCFIKCEQSVNRV